MVLFYPADKKLAYLSRVHSIEMMISTYLMIHFPLLMWKSLDISWTSIFDPINRLILSFFSSRCILGKLHSKVCILVTHQIQFLKYATKIIFLDKVNYRNFFRLLFELLQGVQIATGTYTELLRTCPEFTQWTETTTRQLRSGSGSTNTSSSQLNLAAVPEYLTQLSVCS